MAFEEAHQFLIAITDFDVEREHARSRSPCGSPAATDHTPRPRPCRTCATRIDQLSSQNELIDERSSVNPASADRLYFVQPVDRFGLCLDT